MRIELLLRSAAGLRATVDDMLDLSKIEAGRMEVASAWFALAPLLDELAATARLLVGSKPVAVRVGAPGGLSLDSDRGKLGQVLRNLVSNAAKFTDEGEIAITAARTPDGLWIEVRDTGHGIRTEDLGRLFVPFGQLEDAQVKQGGTGLGLVMKVMDEAPDLVLLDVNLPALSGETLVALLRAREQTRSTRILFYSSNDEDALRRSAVRLGLGLDGYVAKGDPAALCDAVAGALERRALLERAPRE